MKKKKEAITILTWKEDVLILLTIVLSMVMIGIGLIVTIPYSIFKQILRKSRLIKPIKPMEFSEIVRLNLEKDFGKLLSFSPTRYLACNIIAGYGNCQKGIISEDDEAESVILTKSDDFDFGLAKKLILDFSNSKSKKPSFSSLMLCVNLVVPFRTSVFIHRLYEIEEKDGKILLKRESYRE